MPDPALKSELPDSFQFSQSSLQDYADCPRLFQLRYIERLAWPAIEMEPVLENERRRTAGERFHRMVQQHLIGLPVEKLNALPDTPELARWWSTYLEEANNIVGPQGQGRLHVEKILSAPVGAYHLIAKYDLLLLSSNGKAIIYDWKTSRKRPREEWMKGRLQTRVYPAMLVQAGGYLNQGRPIEPEQVEMVYWFAEHPKVPVRFAYTSGQYQRDWDGLCVMIQEISHHRFFPPSEEARTCPYCSYRSYCNRGEKAGLSEDFEATDEAVGGEFDIDFEQVAEIEF